MSEVAGPKRGSRRGSRTSVTTLFVVVFTALAVAAMLSGGVSGCAVDDGFPAIDGGVPISTGTGVCVGATCPDACAKHPVPGCACSVEGQDLLCGTVDATYADGTHVCGKGVSVCTKGVWGACVIDQAVTLVPNTPPGFYTDGLGTGSPCINNPCDPACIDFVDTGAGIGDGGITGSDAGITLTGDGGNVCVPKTCTGVNANCGPVSDTCGGLLNCGTCPAGQSCGGGGPNLCGFGTACTGLCTQQVVCPTKGATTSISGTVYEPNGSVPLPNVVVYVPLAALTPFTPGVECDSAASCLAGSGKPLVTTTTAFDGSFTLTNMPVGTSIPLVMQIGRFRREVTIPNVPACVNTSLATLNPTPCLSNGTTCGSASQCCSNSCSLTNGANPVCDPLTRLPKNQGEGDIPKMAFVTGKVDSLECVWRKVGIDDSEFTPPTGNGRINLWSGNFAPGAYITDYTTTPNEANLLGSPSTLASYDIILFPCQGVDSPSFTGGLQAQYEYNLANYANSGGRVFTTHYSYVWLISDPVCGAGGAACTSGGKCCSGTCTGGVCTNAFCAANGATCTAGSACCSGTCTGGVCAAAPTCAATGATCTSSTQCCAGADCVSGKCATCLGSTATCTTSASCCSNSCTGTTGNKKCTAPSITYTSPSFATCTTNASCAKGTCTSGVCCFPSGTSCSANSDCCGGSCSGGKCLQRQAGPCVTNADCSNGTCAPNGQCLLYSSPLSPAILWDIDQSSPTPDPGTGIISQSFAKGVELSQWLQFVGASSVLGQISINTLRNDFDGVVAPSELWMTLADGTPMEATFNTPLTAAASAQCGRVVHSDFHVETVTNAQFPFPQECPSVATPTPTCFALGVGCSANTDCCSASCSGGVCTSSTCSANGAACTANSGCCSGTCTAGACVASPSCLAAGTTCSSTSQCCSADRCTSGKCVACSISGASCTTSTTCCSGSCTGTTGNKHCTAPTTVFCSPYFANCTTNAGCCGGECTGGVCCLTAGNGCSSDGQCCKGNCSNGTCCGLPSSACTTSSDCCSGSTCNNGVCGGGAGNACSQNSDCASGSCAGNTCCGNPGNTCGQNSDCCSGTCTSGTCTVMDPQELLLANMLFDLASCITPDVVPACVPISCNAQGLDCGMAGDGCGNQISCGTCALPTTCGGGGLPGVCGTPLVYSPANFVRDYDATLVCPAGTGPVWRAFSWFAVTPSNSQISFTVQTAPTKAGLTTAPVETLVFSPVPGPPVPALLNQPVVASTALASDTGSASPDYTLNINKQIQNNDFLRVTATLTPSTDKLHAPTLSSWDMQIDCAPNQ